jgi:hypothetical protein
MSVPGKESGNFSNFFCNLKLTLYESGPAIAYVNIHFAGSEVLTAVVMKSTDVFDEHVAFLFGVEE